MDKQVLKQLLLDNAQLVEKLRSYLLRNGCYNR